MFNYMPVIYLSGPIEADPDDGVSWRKKLVEAIVEKYGTEFKIFDPTAADTSIEAIAKRFDWTGDRRNWSRMNFRKYLLTGRYIVDTDLDWVSNSEILIVGCNKYIWRSMGTAGEVTIAKYLYIPVLLLLMDDVQKEDLPLWLLGCATAIYNDIDSLLLDNNFYNILYENDRLDFTNNEENADINDVIITGGSYEEEAEEEEIYTDDADDVFG